MANLDFFQNLIQELEWNIRVPPTAALTPDWERVVLPGRNFTIIYKIAIPDPETGDDAYQLADMAVPYEADGQPVTVADLLSTIYDFYQEPLDKNDPFYNPPEFERRNNPLGDEVELVSFEQVAPDKYEIGLDLIGAEDFY